VLHLSFLLAPSFHILPLMRRTGVVDAANSLLHAPLTSPTPFYPLGTITLPIELVDTSGTPYPLCAGADTWAAESHLIDVRLTGPAATQSSGALHVAAIACASVPVDALQYITGSGDDADVVEVVVANVTASALAKAGPFTVEAAFDSVALGGSPMELAVAEGPPHCCDGVLCHVSGSLHWV